MSKSDFPEQLASEINRHLGPGATDTFSPEQLIRLFDLGISRETLRRILREGHSPKPSLQEALLHKVRHRVTTAEKFTATSTTRDEILEILQNQAGIEIRRGPGDLLPSDLIMEPLGLGLTPILLRCLDDAGDVRLVHSSYFEPAIKQMKQSMGALGIREAVLLTHRYPQADAVSMAAVHQIKLLEYSMFVAARLRLLQISEFFSSKRKERGVPEGLFESLLAEQVSGHETIPVDSLATLRDHLFKPAGSASAVVLGSFGSGKTSVMLVLAHELAARYTQEPNKWVIPLWLTASAINLPDIDKALVGALNVLTGGPSLPIEAVKRLIKAGRIWLFVDGIDESPQLRGPENVVQLVKALSDLCGEDGRLIMSGRQEMFDTEEQEQELFDQAPKAAGIQRRLILRMQPMSLEVATRVLRSRLGPQSRSMVDDISSNVALSDLVSRPIFMHIIAETVTQLGLPIAQTKLKNLFDTYVRRWVAEESKKTNLLPMREEERLRTCETLAFMHLQYGSREDGFSLKDLETFARSEASPTLSIRDLPEFLNEARVAMFLERRSNDRFDFAHHSLREFFVARKLGRDIREERFWSVGSIPLNSTNRLAKFFVCEFLGDMFLDPAIPLDRALRMALEWDGEESEERLRESSVPGPLFGVGPYCHLLPNLIALRLEAPSSAPIDLRGAHLPMINLDNFLKDQERNVLLDFANLERAHVSPRRARVLRPKGSIPPVVFSSYEVMRKYCLQHGLYLPSRFSERGSDEFVLIPGGNYRVTNWINGAEAGFVEVDVPGFLIQRYPVTNGEFRQFIDKFPYWEASRTQLRTKNDYYLSYWYKLEKELESWRERPVVQVNWYAARAYAAASGLRLPTEVEWEVASRVAQVGELHSRPWGNALECKHGPCVELLNFDGEEPPMFSDRSVLNVPSAFAEWEKELDVSVPRHMLGLIREWVQDYWAPDYPSKTTRLHPVNLGVEMNTEGRWGPAKEMLDDRVIRGGGFTSPPEHITCSYRAPHRPNNVNPDLGFRCVRPVRVSPGRLNR